MVAGRTEGLGWGRVDVGGGRGRLGSFYRLTFLPRGDMRKTLGKGGRTLGGAGSLNP